MLWQRALALAYVILSVAVVSGCSGGLPHTSIPFSRGPRSSTSFGSNPIVRENMRIGSREWRVPWGGFQTSDDINLQIKGYPSAESVAPGGSIQFMVTVNPAQSFTVDVFRLGDYQGLGGRRMVDLGPFSGVTQPPCSIDATTRMNYCTWTPSLTLKIPQTWISGVYVAVLSSAAKYQSVIPFWVVDHRRADILYISSLNTYEAYNNFPHDSATDTLPLTGHSLYTFNSANRQPAVKVSFDRPFSDRWADGDGGLYRFEPELIGFLEHSGYNVTYVTEPDVDANPGILLQYLAVVVGGHAEYQSMNSYNGLTNARDDGVGLAFVSSDEIIWQIRYEANAAGTPYRVIVGYKNTAPDPEPNPNLRTIEWSQLGRPAQLLVGVGYPSGGVESPSAGMQPWVPENTTHWAFTNTGLVAGQPVNAELVGYEIDSYDPTIGMPTGIGYTLLSASPFKALNRTLTQNSSIYQSLAGNWVWAVGTMAWSWGLYPGTPAERSGNDGHNVEPSIQQMTTNVLNKMIGLPAPTSTPSPTPAPTPTPTPLP